MLHSLVFLLYPLNNLKRGYGCRVIVSPNIRMSAKAIEELEALRAEQLTLQKALGPLLKAKDKDAIEAQKAKLKTAKAAIVAKETEIKEKYPDADISTKKKKKKTAAKKEKVVEASGENFGVLPTHQSQKSRTHAKRNWVKIGELNAKRDGEEVFFRSRIHSIRGKSSKLTFLVLRQRLHTIQAVLDESAGLPRAMIKFAKKIPNESLVNIAGVCRKSPVTIDGCTQQDAEIRVTGIWIESSALRDLPLSVEDCGRPMALIEAQSQEIARLDKLIRRARKKIDAGGDAAALEKEIEDLQQQKSAANKYVWPNQQTRLDNRIIDLRTQANQAIFRIQSGVGALFREFLLSQGFTEIHSPKILGAASEGGSEVFKVEYFDSSAFLAQSPQLYKQMAICSDMQRVFEIGPVFRAESSFTHRHLTEFVGLDLEMEIQDHYHEVLDVLDGLFLSIFEGLEKRYATELKLINEQFPFEPLKFKRPSPRLNFKDGMELLRTEVTRLRAEIAKAEAALKSLKGDELEDAEEILDDLRDQLKRALGDGDEISDVDDLSTPQEKLLGRLVKAKHGVDFYFLDKYPAEVRPFYTMIDPEDERYTNSYDLFIRCEEICSGSQRIHDPEFLKKRAIAKEIPIHTIQDYINSFKYGAPPHGGGGVGLERVVMLYLGLNNIRKSSMFPRDPTRLTP
eukprot:TRINITY_DN2287_c0_g1_i1.p1 TRINITY_DN2287_c0_g1~~TRINITY_DN2287_c0_g1_i1.p1  ORF type:complete len:681 (-),score=164.63 TRINITY_DN2287_c0_g1_i1:39-2081(-)